MLKYFIFTILLSPLIANAGGSMEYFPKEKLDLNNKIDVLKIDYYSIYLTAMHEPSLWEMSKSKQKSEVYRFLLLRSFHNPVCVRIDATKLENIRVFKKVANGGHGDINDLIIDETIKISEIDLNNLLKMLDNVKFWDFKSSETPIMKKEDTNFIVTADGSSWIFEGVKNGKYQVVDFTGGNNTINDHGIIKELGKMFLSVADLKVDPLY